MLPLKLVLAVLGCAAILNAQPKQFDVASIKTAEFVNDYGKGLNTTSLTPTSIFLKNYSLKELVQWAYRLRAYQVGGPDWMGSERYDLTAKTSAPVSEYEERKMLQKVIAERFQLAVHTETKELLVYLLEAVKAGPKLQPTKTDPSDVTRVVKGAYVYDHVSMSEFAGRLSTLRDVSRPVVDRTGIEGMYDVTIKFAESNKDLKIGMRDGDNPSIFRLVTEQLGLRLAPGKAPMEMLVVDHAEKTLTGN